jgi:hypothetical protein
MLQKNQRDLGNHQQSLAVLDCHLGVAVLEVEEPQYHRLAVAYHCQLDIRGSQLL